MLQKLALLGALALLCSYPCGALADDGKGPPDGRPGGPPAGRGGDALKDRIGGVPEAILDQQSRASIEIPTLDDVCERAAAAAREAALPLIDTGYHTGKRLDVPGDYATIQAAIDAACARDTVVVAAGTYYELIRMKAGVKLISGGADDLTEVTGARLMLPKRALETVLDGSKAEASRHGMIDFEPGTGAHTIVDGFTLQRLPEQNHHVPGHAHAINVRGASPVVLNCLIQDNGSTGIGNHVVYRDQGQAIGRRDFRFANIEHETAAVIYHNIIRGNLGLGIGSNHFSAARILGNEVYGNDDSVLAGAHGEQTAPGLGAKHGAAPVVVGNLVHHNAGGGILCKAGQPQGAHAIDRAPHPTVRRNVVWENGTDRPAISAADAGSETTPVVFEGNWVFDAPLVGIGLSGDAVGVIEDNLVVRSRHSGIAVNGATALRLNRNRVTGAGAPGFMIAGGARVVEMTDNAAESSHGPRFMLRGGSIGPANDE